MQNLYRVYRGLTLLATIYMYKRHYQSHTIREVTLAFFLQR